MNTAEIMELCDKVRETAYAIHRYHGRGYLEKVDENALTHRLRRQDLDVKQQYPLMVCDEDGTIMGDYYVDLLIEDMLVAELKACNSVRGEHTAQLLNYLKGTGKEHGLLINFGSHRFYIRKFIKTHHSGSFMNKLPALFFAFFRGG
jgi:GxxExxY protein